MKLLPQSDAVAGVSVILALEGLRQGNIVALPWQRPPWASIHNCPIDGSRATVAG